MSGFLRSISKSLDTCIRRALYGVQSRRLGHPERTFCTRMPGPQNAVDLFKDGWFCKIPLPDVESGGMQVFDHTQDVRPSLAVNAFGGIEGFRVLELGPCEAGHTYQLERFGAKEVVAIEASEECFLKCLVVKEVLGMRARFLLGDFVKYMASTEESFDLLFASGVLYHMTDPARFLQRVSTMAPRLYIWSHYVSAEDVERWGRPPRSANIDGFECNYYPVDYDPADRLRVVAGTETAHCYLMKQDIVRCLRFFGFPQVKILEDQTDHPHGPCLSLAAARDGIRMA